MSNEKRQVGRLAFRVEGDWWVAYFAQVDTMRDAIELGRIAMRLVQEPRRKQAFMGIMKDVVSEFMQNTFGQAPDDFVTRQAPEHERAGRA